MDMIRTWLMKWRHGKATVTMVGHNAGYIRRLFTMALNEGRKVNDVLHEHYGLSMNNPEFSYGQFLGMLRKGRLPITDGAMYKQLYRICEKREDGLYLKDRRTIEKFMDDKYTELWRTLQSIKAMNSGKSKQPSKQQERAS